MIFPKTVYAIGCDLCQKEFPLYVESIEALAAEAKKANWLADVRKDSSSLELRNCTVHVCPDCLKYIKES